MADCKICGAPARSKNSDLCEKHYMRWYRKGTYDLEPKSTGYIQSGGYKMVPAKGHPLRVGKKSNFEYEHRIVYYDAHGAGPFQCKWCDATVTWNDLHIDHLDDSKTNNDVSNLAATCPTCNQARGREKQRKTMVAKVGRLFEYKGVQETAGHWAQKAGISRNSFLWRIKNGWSVEDAVETPRGKYGPKK